MATVFLEMQKLQSVETGLGQVCLHLGQALAQLSPPDFDFGFYLPQAQAGRFGPRWRYIAERRMHRWTGVAAPDCGVWHCLHQDSRYWPRQRSVPVVLTIHDLNFLVQSGSASLHRRRLRQLQARMDRAAAITTISNFTAGVVRATLRVPDVPFQVIHNGNTLDPSTAPVRPAWAPQRPYLLAIAHIHPKKNLAVLVPLLARRRDLVLVLAGQDDHPYAAQIRQQAQRLGVSDRLLMPGVVNAGERMWLLQNCLALALPSLAEGFGLPVIEAMSVGKPVFLSRHASLPEVGGDEAFYWDDFDADAMTAVLDAGLQSFQADPSWPERLRQRAGTFSWEVAARRYLTLYRELAAGRQPGQTL